MNDPENSGATTSSPLDAFADPRSLLAVVWGGRRLIVGCLAGCLALAAVYLLMANRLYEASAKLLVIEQGNSPMSAPGGQSRSLVNSLEDAIPTHLAILSSPVVVRGAVESVGLNNLPSLGSSPRNVETATIEVVEGLQVSRPERLAKIIEIAYRAKSREEALRMVGAVTKSYQKFLSEVYAQSNSEVVVLMTKARDDLNRELKELEARYLEFRKKSPSLLGDASGRTFFGQRLEEWNRASRDAMVRAVQLKAQLELGRELARKGVGLWSIAHAMDQMAGGSNNGLAQRAQANSPGAPVDYLRQLAAEQQRLADALGPQSTKVKELQEQMARARSSGKEARDQMERGDVEELLDSVGKSLSSLEGMRKDMQAEFETDLKLAKTAEAEQIAEANLKSEMERQRKLFDTVVDQLKQATLVGDYVGTRAVLVEPPTAILKAVRPKTSLTLALALGAGLALGLATALGTELVAPRVRSLADLRRALRLPVLGELPFVGEAGRPATGSIGLICQTMPRSPMAEAFRVVRANLDLARRGREAKVVMVTAPEARDGTSTVASNLAVALAQAGRSVALVDANLRTPTLHATFGLIRDRGLSHLIRDLLPLTRVAQPTRVSRLELIAAGPEVTNSAELLSSPELGQLLDRLREEYDDVVVDAPPLLAFADASILGAVVDAVVLVVLVGTTRRADAVRAVEVLKGLGTPVAGFVVNGGNPELTPSWTRASSRPAPEPDKVFQDRPDSPSDPSSQAPTPLEIPHDPRMTSGAGTSEGALGLPYDPRMTFQAPPPAAFPWLSDDPTFRSPRHATNPKEGGLG